jgi:hypothetical protein
MTNVEAAGDRPGRGPVDGFVHIREFPAADFRDVVKPNFDTLYSPAWLDLREEPRIISLPATVRFVVNRVRPRKPKRKAVAFSRVVRKAGPAAIRFTGRLKKSRALPPGKYRLTARATDGAGLKSVPRRATFRIVR